MENNWHDRFLNITWSDLRNLTFTLFQKIGKTSSHFDLAIAIARGGLTITQLLSDHLKLPIAAFTVESYKNLKQEKLPHITYGLSTPLNGKKILLVDDVCDTGKTFLRGLAYLEELGAKRADIKSASLHYKPHAEVKPDFYVAETSAWVIYPYEVRETIEQLLPLWQKAGVAKAEMTQRFISWGFPPEQVEYLMHD